MLWELTKALLMSTHSICFHGEIREKKYQKCLVEKMLSGALLSDLCKIRNGKNDELTAVFANECIGLNMFLRQIY